MFNLFAIIVFACLGFSGLWDWSFATLGIVYIVGRLLSKIVYLITIASKSLVFVTASWTFWAIGLFATFFCISPEGYAWVSLLMAWFLSLSPAEKVITALRSSKFSQPLALAEDSKFSNSLMNFSCCFVIVNTIVFGIGIIYVIIKTGVINLENILSASERMHLPLFLLLVLALLCLLPLILMHTLTKEKSKKPE